MTRAVETLNEGLKALDREIREGGLSVPEYRRRRRRLILEVEEPGSTIPDQTEDATVEQRRTPDAPATRPAPAPRSVGGGRARIFLGLAALGILAVAVLFAWSQLGSEGRPGSGERVAGAPGSLPAPVAGESSGATGADPPQVVADRLVKSDWSDAAVSGFLEEWRRVSPEARHAARDHATLWLLRGETERRLRDASDAHAVDPTPATQARLEQLAQVRDAIRAE